MPRALVIDDDDAIREMVALTLEASGFEVARARGARDARKELEKTRPDVILCDIYMPGGDGLSVLREVRARVAPPPVILMTARGSVETAAAAEETGAFDYLAKPFDVSVLLDRVSAALAACPARQAPAEDGPESMIIGSHPAVVEVYKAVARVARLRVPVLVLGETGTGKELVARALHRFSGRGSGPLVPVHCGAIPDTLLESELFGHRRGAFTDATRDRRGALSQAAGGTLFLDEIGEVSAAFQVKLLRFLEDRVVTPVGADAGEAVDVRVVAGTHRDVKGMVGEGRFREDLYYRLSGYVIRIPPLRERLSDLPALVAHFERLGRRELGLPEMATASPAVLARLGRHAWPGNVRELAHVVRRALIDAGRLDDDAAVEQALREGAGPAAAPPRSRPIGGEPLPATPPTLEEIERHHILSVLASAGGNQTVAARLLGIERKTLARKLRAAGGPVTEGGEGEER